MPDPTPTPRVVHDLADSTAAPPGVAWRLDEPGRQLDANVLHLAPDQVVETHVEPDLDVLVVVVSGSGRFESGDTVDLAPGALVWLPRGAARRLVAGAGGLGYLTVHRRRPGMRIGSGPPQPGPPGWARS